MSDLEHFLVIENNQEQMALWQPDRELPSGWHRTAYSGTKDECMEYMMNQWMRHGHKSGIGRLRRSAAA